MKYVLDVQYNGNENAVVACIGFKNWNDKKASYAKTHFIENIEPYEAGFFYRRELPCLLEALHELDDMDCVIVDGYVWLEEVTHFGLGLHLYHALKKMVPVVGVAKTLFSGTPKECALLRGESKKPLFISSVDMELEEAKVLVLQMSGKYRIPTFLKEVDGLARGTLSVEELVI
jgi:deoxyinosine 3'endonuclease (endonuclease V)